MNQIFGLAPQTEFETHYLTRVNRGFLWLLVAHLPLAAVLPYLFGTSYLEAVILFALVLSMPLWATLSAPGARSTSCLLAVSGICVSGILIHLSKGMIEFHFHIFVVLAWMITFGNPWALLSAAVTAAVHHLAFFFILPASVFNYQASISIVLLHAAFVVAETAVNVAVAMRIHRMIASQTVFRQNTEGVRSAVNSMAERFSDSVARLNLQSGNLQSAASSLTEINQMVSSTADNALAASKAGQDTQATMGSSKQVVATLRDEFEKLVDSTRAGETAIRKSFDDIRQLLKFFSEIETKTQVINEIVFQTRLLSFNASVEAARAGEHGKGFAVVAEEIGNLAQLSGNGAKEINLMLTSGNEKSQAIMASAILRAESSFEEMIRKVVGNRAQSERCLESFDQIADSLAVTNDRLAQIAKANEEQRIGVENLAKTFAEVADAAEEVTVHAQLARSEGKKEADASLVLLTHNLERALDGEVAKVGDPPVNLPKTASRKIAA